MGGSAHDLANIVSSTDLGHGQALEAAGHESVGLDSDVGWNKVSLEENEHLIIKKRICERGCCSK